ncbi:MAG: flagellin, partial [Armatimonadia bacterium]|nr:flagellin [Armatimonadia bacterium]
MALRVNTNVSAMTAARNIKRASSMMRTSVERLSSGLRINHANDDPAGMAIAEKIRTQVQGLNRASMNALDGVSLLQTAEAALGEVQSMLQRIRELAIQAANGTLTANDRVQIQREVDQLL